jgi:hypothetical protein
MKYENDSYEPTEEECEAIDRAGMVAAWHELQPIKNEELPIQQKVLACLRAFKSARAAVFAEVGKLEEAHPDASYIGHSRDITVLICTALAGIDVDHHDLPSISEASDRILALLQATKALEAMSALESALEEDSEVFGTHLADEATQFAQVVIGKYESS